MAGRGDRGVIEFTADTPIDQDLRANLVVTMQGAKITTMQDYRRRSKARRAARVPPAA